MGENRSQRKSLITFVVKLANEPWKASCVMEKTLISEKDNLKEKSTDEEHPCNRR